MILCRWAAAEFSLLQDYFRPGTAAQSTDIPSMINETHPYMDARAVFQEFLEQILGTFIQVVLDAMIKILQLSRRLRRRRGQSDGRKTLLI